MLTKQKKITALSAMYQSNYRYIRKINCVQKISLHDFGTLEIQNFGTLEIQKLISSRKFLVQTVADFVLCKPISNLTTKPQNYLCLQKHFSEIGSSLHNALGN